MEETSIKRPGSGDAEPWSPPPGYKLVLDIVRGGFAPGFDLGRTYRFLRHGEDTPQIFCLKDANPAFNIGRLFFEELDEDLASQHSLVCHAAHRSCENKV